MGSHSTSPESTEFTGRLSADATSSSRRAAASAATSTGRLESPKVTEVSAVLGLRFGTSLEPDLVATLRAVAERADIAHRVLTILESGQGSKSSAVARCIRQGH